jgi:membrane protease subunit (stomatin/prohibitin family)
LEAVLSALFRLTYKEGYENRVKNEVEQDLQQIHSQYQSIIDIMKAKIADTDEIIKVKRAAKGEFAYALSKNLLKTISNLSMEVMSLNQMSLNDG